jgi:hypothetical protein
MCLPDCRKKVAEISKDEVLFKNQALGSNKGSMRSSRFEDLPSSGGDGSSEADDMPDPVIQARLKSALSSDLDGEQSIKVRWCGSRMYLKKSSSIRY